MDMWKWNLAFQCIVNIGVRGSETVRTRVVEADMVPVVATLLDNYMQAIEKCREKEASRNTFHISSSSRSQTRPVRTESRSSHAHRSDRNRRQAPPPIEIPQTQTGPIEDATHLRPSQIPMSHQSLSSPPDQTTFARQRQHHLNPSQPFQTSEGARTQFSTPVQATQPQSVDQIFASSPFRENVSGFGIRPVRDIDRLPSMLTNIGNADLSSQPVSPSTPAPASRNQQPANRPVRRPSIRHQLSVSGTSWEDEEQNEEVVPLTSNNVIQSPEPIVGLQTDIVMQDVTDEAQILDGSTTPVTLSVPNVNVADHEIFPATHRLGMDDSRNNATATPPQTQAFFNPIQPLPPVNVVNVTPPNVRQTLDSYFNRLPILPGLLAALPRDEDVIMALQLLAYVSKYCNLRSYFQATHLVSRLKVGADLRVLDSDCEAETMAGRSQEELDEEWDNEFVEKNEEAYNIFPLIERFTIRTSSSKHALHPASPQQSETMQYWAGVVMRNLCRKDESRGGIRQCAYWRCGKWEEFQRQFAKCRRCRRTKYCSKECQKGAWGTHRFWCVAAEDGREGEGPRHHGHGHSHGHHHHHRTSHHGHHHSTTTQSRDGPSAST